MKHYTTRHLLRSLCIGVSIFALTGCVDHDYDLSEDIDLTIKLGGDNLTLPGSSSTDILSLSQILDLEDNSSIKPVAADGEYGLAKGDYVLIQDGDQSSSQFDIPEITIGHINGNTSTQVLPEFYNVTGEASISQQVNTVVPNAVRLEDNDVTTELISIEKADIDVEMMLQVGYISSDFTGKAYIEPGYTVTFDKCWTIEIVDQATARFIETVGNNAIRFKTRQAITNTDKQTLRLRLSKVDLTDVPAGQGLYAPGKFKLSNDIESNGEVSLDISDLGLGERANLTIETTTWVNSAVIEKVRGIVDPKIEISETSFNIDDIPDFLSDPKNHLDIENPQINITVSNTSPLSISLSGKLSSFCDASMNATVGIGEDFGTNAIIVRGNSTTEFVISRRPVSGAANNIVVPDLGKLIETIPDRISFHDATSKALRETAEYALGSTYSYKCDYQAVIPLAFGDAMKLFYTHEDTDWDSDLEKYNFGTAEVTLDVLNTIPLDLTPSAIALDVNGNEMNKVTATVEGNIAAGSINSPATSAVKIILRSTGSNMAGLDGIKLMLDATANTAFRGTNLNENQSLKFENIRITVKGGVLVDLND
ncbi:MAG: hypothetical protein J6C95_04440 [Muribaculaceae bacterium]|nr:hypothetical protein [Muribaculaceae bacterium]